MCTKRWGRCWNLVLHGKVWAFKWCKNCSNIAFHLGDTTIRHYVFILHSSHFSQRGFFSLKHHNHIHGLVQQLHIQHFNNQLTHTTLKNVELLKHFTISKTAPTYFGLQGNHHQGATISTWLKITNLVKSRYVKAVQDVVSVMAAHCDL